MKYKIEFKGEFMKENKESIALVDISIIMHTLRQAKKQVNYLEGILSSLRSIRTQLGVSRIVCVLDAGASSYRKGIYPPYKEHREELRKKYTEEEKARLAEMRQWYSNLHLFDNAFCSVSTKFVEADDLLSLYYYDLVELGYEVTVASKDKDLITALPLKVLYDIGTQRGYSLEDKAFGLSPNKYLMFQTLMGDSQDNIMSYCTKSASLILVKNFKTFNDMIKFEGDVSTLEGVTPHNKRFVVTALETLKQEDIIDKLKLNYELVKIFKDKKLLTEPQLKEYEKGLQKILAWKPSQEVSDEAELFLWEQQSGHLIDELAWGV